MRPIKTDKELVEVLQDLKHYSKDSNVPLVVKFREVIDKFVADNNINLKVS